MNDNDGDFADVLAVGDRLARSLCHGLPRATALLREHEAEHGEVLATLLLSDVGDWYVAAWLARDADCTTFSEVQQLAARIDARYLAGVDTERTMIVTGFLEALPNPGEDGRGAVAELPTRLRRERERMDSPRS